MNRKTLLFIATILLIASVAWGQVTIVPPTVSGTGADTAANDSLRIASGNLEDDINAQIAGYLNQPLLAQAIGNAGAASVHVGSQRSYIDYRGFAAVVGGGFAFSASSFSPSIADDAITTLEQDGDLYAAVAVQPSASLGFPLGFISDDLYVNFKVGAISLDETLLGDGISYSAFNIGALVNYQLLETRQLPLGFLRWRGLSLGSGIIYQQNELTFDLAFGAVSQAVDSDGDSTDDTTITVDPVLSAVASSNSVVIPLEANTGLRILWLIDVAVGAGVDVSFGGSEVDLQINGPVTIVAPAAGTATDGSVNVGTGTSGDGPDIIRPRVMGSVGVNLGPVKVGVPAMLYFDEDGNTGLIGLNVGIVW